MADRMSVNLELPTADSLRALAPHKSRTTILNPIKAIQSGISQSRLAIGKDPHMDRAYGNEFFSNSIFKDAQTPQLELKEKRDLSLYSSRSFVPAGQSTQMIIGATPENDYQILSVSQALYQKFDMKRVFYSAYIAINEDKLLPALDTKPPLLREHRLYQADWLLRYYGFRAEELLSEDRPNFNVLLDPKCDWALRHLEWFPVEINRAGYEALLRVPGIGMRSARRILRARKDAVLDFPDLKCMGVVLKRAVYFITCAGKTMFPLRIEEDYITKRLVDSDRQKNWQTENPSTYRQLSLFDDMKVQMMPEVEDTFKTVSGQM
jgi:putative DNA modification/repair radical SAM protein